jgi:hypothetical protein
MCMTKGPTLRPSARASDPMSLAESIAAFQAFKTDLIAATGLSKDALHVYFGLTAFLFVRLIWRRRGGWVLAWMAALAMALGGEWLDLRGENLRGALQPDSAHWHDIWNTMFWPTMLAIFGRWLQPQAKADPPEPDPDLADERA